MTRLALQDWQTFLSIIHLMKLFLPELKLFICSGYRRQRNRSQMALTSGEEYFPIGRSFFQERFQK